MNKIARFEALAERLVEGTFARLFAGRLHPLKVATHLTRAMEDHQILSPTGVPQAPTHYWVYLHPHDCEALEIEQPSLTKELARHVVDLAAQAGLSLDVTPVVCVLPDENVIPHNAHVEARWMLEGATKVEGTREMAKTSDEPEVETAATKSYPFLILEGRRHVELQRAVISIGRALDNDVIIEDPRVSRYHAQLRQRYGRYVLYDVGSSDGTQINGYPVEECVLHSGDVISFAGIQVIYGEDPPTPAPLPDSEDTPPLVSPEGEPD
jgi:hypothetical protein